VILRFIERSRYSQGVEVNSLKMDGIRPALAVAAAADVVILALGIDKSQEGEGHDRRNIVLPGERPPTVTHPSAIVCIDAVQSITQSLCTIPSTRVKS
jgi:hypothetical protein